MSINQIGGKYFSAIAASSNLRRYCQRWNRGQGRSYNGIDRIYEMSGLA